MLILPAPLIDEGLGLGYHREQITIQELIPEPAVERLDKTILPRRPGLDGGSKGVLRQHLSGEAVANDQASSGRPMCL